jgi:hypothetical protein
MAVIPNHTESNRELVAFRAPRTLVDEVRKLARRDGDTQATILRRLIRSALNAERRSLEHGGGER